MIRREVPLLAHRTTINKVLKQVRIALGLGHYKGSEWKPVISVTEANKICQTDVTKDENTVM